MPRTTPTLWTPMRTSSHINTWLLPGACCLPAYLAAQPGGTHNHALASRTLQSKRGSLQGTLVTNATGPPLSTQIAGHWNFGMLQCPSNICIPAALAAKPQLYMRPRSCDKKCILRAGLETWLQLPAAAFGTVALRDAVWPHPGTHWHLMPT